VNVFREGGRVISQADIGARILAALERVPAGLTTRQLVLALGYAETDEQSVDDALRILRGRWDVERYERSTPTAVVSVWQHRRYTDAHRILFVIQEAA
jgi:hypothetical protein